MATQPFPLSILCDVTVSVLAAGVTTPTFNQGLINGNSGRIPPGSRCLLFLSVAAMIEYGFEANDPETIAAGLYFGQTPPPLYLWVGCQVPTAIGSVAIGTDAGTGYVAGDIVVPTQGGAMGGQIRIAAVNGSGVVTALALVPGSQGTGYAIANNLPTTGGTGTGLEIDISTIGETPLQAITACRIAQPAWYLAMSTTAVDADHLAITEYAQSVSPQMQYVYGTASASALNGTAGNIFSLIKAGNYSRGHGAYSTTQAGGAPNNAYIAAAIMGKAMGLNTGLANSNFTLASKVLAGITVEPITPAQANVFGGLAGLGTANNGNYYVNFQNSYTFYQQGVNGNGTWFDQILGLDQMAADCQISVTNLLNSLVSIPQTDAGQALIINAVQGACERAVNRGFLAPGIWNGPQVLNLTPGTSLPAGYRVQSASFNTQPSGARALRQGMPVYVTIILAGSQQSFTIGINVQQ